MDEQAIQELTAQAGLALLVFGTAAMALLELMRGVFPALGGTKAGVVAKLLSVAAVVVVLADAMPMLGYYIAIALIATQIPGTTHDLKEAVRKYFEQAARQVEFDDVEANTAADEGA